MVVLRSKWTVVYVYIIIIHYKLYIVLLYCIHSRRLLRGERALRLIQRVWRGFVCRNVHIRKRFERANRLRRHALILMQSVGRRYNAIKYVAAKRGVFITAVILIQKVYRGHVTRFYLKRVKGAKRLQKLCRRFRIWKFQDAVSVLLSLQ